MKDKKKKKKHELAKWEIGWNESESPGFLSFINSLSFNLAFLSSLKIATITTSAVLIAERVVHNCSRYRGWIFHSTYYANCILCVSEWSQLW